MLRLTPKHRNVLSPTVPSTYLIKFSSPFSYIHSCISISPILL
ncbi:hypothetical protein QUI_2161 [Clostridioides difficile P59]|nr:hypothetical protein QUI_2161 [Clostridioides difficile P59]